MAADPCSPRRISCAPLISWGPGEADIVLFDSCTGSYHALNASATAIWLHLSAGLQLPAIAAAISAAHGLAPEEAVADVSGFFETALHAGLVIAE